MNPGIDPAGNWFVGFPAAPDPATLDRLLAGAPPVLRRLHPADLHLTLAFLGRLPADRVAAVRARLAAMTIPPIDAVAASLALLPTPRRPSALALCLDRGRDRAAGAIARCRQPLLEAAGRPPDDRQPLPHLTIARPPRRLRTTDLEALRRWCRSLAFEPIPVPLAPPRLFGWSTERPQRQFETAD